MIKYHFDEFRLQTVNSKLNPALVLCEVSGNISLYAEAMSLGLRATSTMLACEGMDNCLPLLIGLLATIYQLLRLYLVSHDWISN
jgi:hypothetical protein